MRVRKLLIVVAAVALISAGFLVGRTVEKKGTPDSSSAPGVTSSYTLEDIYNRLASGADGTQAAFAEPTVAAGAGTMYTLDAIMGEAPVRKDTTGATKADVLANKEFWGLNVNAGQWGLQTGDGDPNLVAGNIKDGVIIFGVTGELHGGCTCTGTMNGTRWCDNGDGTVTDLNTCLVWLKKADWGGLKPWEDCTNHEDAHTRVSLLSEADPTADLHDYSHQGDWRLPTHPELLGLAYEPEAVRSDDMKEFTGVQSDYYWSSTTYHGSTHCAWRVDMGYGLVNGETKLTFHYVWPVRGPFVR